MSEEKQEGRNFVVSVEDCEKWVQRLRRMANALEKKDESQHEDGIKMFYTCAVLMQKLGLEIRRDAMFENAGAMLGSKTVGEA